MTMGINHREIVFAKLDFDGYPLGSLFSGWKPGTNLEEQYLSGWWNASWRNPSGQWCVVEDGGRTVLEHPAYIDQYLITGDPLWCDYVIEASIRQMLPNSVPVLWMDHEFSTVGRTGIMLRYQTSRRYYFYGIEGYDRLVLYRREDRNWLLLDEFKYPFNRERYYVLKVEVKDQRIRCFLDGEKKLEAKDKAFPSGKVGIRSNCRSRIKELKISTTSEKQTVNSDYWLRYYTELAKLREEYPNPVLWRKIDISRYGPCNYKFGNLRGREQKDILLCQSGFELGERAYMIALDLNGDILWQIPGLCSVAKMYDINGDQCEEIACLRDDKLAILDGSTGRVLAETRSRSDEQLTGLFVCNLRGTEIPQDFIVIDPYRTVWAYDNSLDLLWERKWRHAHQISVYDIDGDGREEVMAGFTMGDGEGNVLWEMEGSGYIWTHPNNVVTGELDGDETDGLEVVVSVGGEGFFLLNAKTGKIRRHHTIGHAHNLSVGNYRPDLPGLEIWVSNRWGSNGLLTLFGGNGDYLYTFEPDNVGEGGPPVNWSGNGQELMLLNGSEESLGLYDGYGRKVVEFPDDGHPFAVAQVAQLTGDARDEIAFADSRTIYIYTQDRPFPKGERIYSPIRKNHLELPWVSYPNWKINDV